MWRVNARHIHSKNLIFICKNALKCIYLHLIRLLKPLFKLGIRKLGYNDYAQQKSSYSTQGD